MRKSLVAVVLLPAGGAFAPAAAPFVAAIDRSALASLQGTWLVTHAEQGGERVALGKSLRLNLTIAGVCVRERATGDDKVKGDLEIAALDASAKPHTIDFKSPGDEKPHVGVFKIEGGTLVLCLDDPGKARPTAFVTKKGEARRVIFWMKRQKK